MCIAVLFLVVFGGGRTSKLRCTTQSDLADAVGDVDACLEDGNQGFELFDAPVRLQFG